MWPIDRQCGAVLGAIEHDVEDGRRVLNFSEWDRRSPTGRAWRGDRRWEMLPLQYRLLHPGARLSDTEKADLVAGLTRTYQQDPPGP